MSDPRPLPRRIYDAIVLRHERTWHFPLALTVLFGLFNAYAHVIHEPWRDELHCWGVGRIGTGLWDILTGDRRYDGHPFLWYYLLHLVSLAGYLGQPRELTYDLLEAACAGYFVDDTELPVVYA